MSETDIVEVKTIEDECQVSQWSLLDYRIETKRNDALSFVVKEHNKVVGFIISRLITNPSIFTSINSEKSELTIANQIIFETDIEIYNIVVKPAYQGQGVGQKLINQIISSTANLGLRSIWLEVRKSNSIAIKFYEKNGFTKVFNRRNFYNNPIEDGIVMKKGIDSFLKKQT